MVSRSHPAYTDPMHQRTWLSLLTLPLVAGFTFPMVVPPQARIESRQTSQDPLAGIADIQDVLSLIRDNYVDPVDMERVLSGGIQAALERAHPLNSYLTTEDLRAPDPGPAEAGLRVVKRGIYAQVLSVLPEGPAAKAGLLQGDIIRKIDGESVGNLTAWSVARRLRGQVGSSLSLLRYSVVSGETRTLELKRVLMPRTPLSLRREGKGSVVALPDLEQGRAQEFREIVKGLDPKLPLLLDLRQCVGGTLEEAAQVASLLGLSGAVASIQEKGRPDRDLPIPPALTPAVPRIGVLMGSGTAGPGEALASAMKQAKLPSFGDRTASLGACLIRIPLRMGGAVEIVNQRWTGRGGEHLDGQAVVPEQPLRGLRPDEDPVPKALELLETAPDRKASLLFHPLRLPGSQSLPATA
jgi:carboxyl-terminal processing protease